MYKKKASKTQSSKVVFKVQIAAGNKNIKLNPNNFKGLKEVSVVSTKGVFYKYLYGSTSDYNEAKENLKVAKSKGYNTAYLIAFKDGKKITIQEALK